MSTTQDKQTKVDAKVDAKVVKMKKTAKAAAENGDVADPNSPVSLVPEKKKNTKTVPLDAATMTKPDTAKETTTTTKKAAATKNASSTTPVVSTKKTTTKKAATTTTTTTTATKKKGKKDETVSPSPALPKKKGKKKVTAEEMMDDDDDNHATGETTTEEVEETPESSSSGEEEGGSSDDDENDDDNDENSEDGDKEEDANMPSQATFISYLKKGLRLNKKRNMGGGDTTATASSKIDCIYFGNTEPSSPKQITDFLANMATNGAVDMTNLALFVNSAAAIKPGEHSFPSKLAGLQLVHRFVVQRPPENQIPKHPRSRVVVPKAASPEAEAAEREEEEERLKQQQKKNDNGDNDATLEHPSSASKKRKAPEDGEEDGETTIAATTNEGGETATVAADAADAANAADAAAAMDQQQQQQQVPKKKARTQPPNIIGDANPLIASLIAPHKDPLGRMFPRRSNGAYGNVICNEIALYVSPNIATNSEAYVQVPNPNNVIPVANKMTSTVLEFLRLYWKATHYVAVIQKMPDMSPLEADGADTPPQRREFRGWTIISRNTDKNTITGLDMSRMEHTRGGYAGYARMYSIVRTMRAEECKSARQDFDLYAGTKGEDAAADAYERSAWLKQHWPAPGSKAYQTMDLGVLRKQLAFKGKLASRRTYVDESGKRVSKTIAKKRRADAALAKATALAAAMGGEGGGGGGVTTTVDAKKKAMGTGRPRFGGLMVVSNEMKKFIEDNGVKLEGDGTRASRSQFTKAVNIYIGENNLRREGDRTKINLDDRLKNLLKVPEDKLGEQTAFTIMRYMGHHYIKNTGHGVSDEVPSDTTDPNAEVHNDAAATTAAAVTTATTDMLPSR